MNAESSQPLAIEGEGPSNRSAGLRAHIEEEIATRRLLPGTRLDEQELARRFQVSRTPVREALLQLASEGLVQLRPRRGAVVREISMPRLIEMFELMGELEALCAKLAARRMSDTEREALRAAHERCREAHAIRDTDGYYYRNEVFHRLIYQGSHNTFLTEQAENLHRRLQAYRRLQLRARNRIDSSFEEHQAIVDAILAGDPERAAQMMRGHIIIQGERFGDLMAMLELKDSPVS
jgi:DNA-binding GntR family transcriptional regulator